MSESHGWTHWSAAQGANVPPALDGSGHAVTVYGWWTSPLFAGGISPADRCRSHDPTILTRPHELPRIPPSLLRVQLDLFDADGC